MATVESSVVQAASLAPVARVPALCAGDRLTRPEFERRYSAMPNVMKAELIEGVVYMPSRASMNYAGPRFDAIGFLGYYCVATPGVEGADNTTVRLDWENEPQPDALLRISPQHGGQSRDEDGFIAGPPELIAEISASSAATICTTSSEHTSATAFANTWYGACGTRPLTGSGSGKGGSSACRYPKKDFVGARSFQDFGSTCQP